MAPKRKIVKKTVRKAKSKAQTPPPPSSEPELPSPAAADADTPCPFAADSDIPAVTEPAADASVANNDSAAAAVTEPDADASVANSDSAAPAVTEPAADASEAKGTAAPEPTYNENLEHQPEDGTETLRNEPESAAMVETPAEEPAATETLEAEATSGGASEEPSEAAKKKTVTRVRKVIKKKVVKKLVPKAAVAAKEETKVAEEAQKVQEDEDEEIDASKPDEEQRETDNPSSGDAPAPMEVASKEEDTTKAEAVEKAHDEKIEEGLKEEEKGGDLEMDVTEDNQTAISKSNSRKKTEIFIGGLDRDAKEEDLRKVFGEAGEIVEVRMIMDGQSGKNKGYAFLRYADASHAKKAVSLFEKVEVCGKLCGASALKENDTIFLGNIDKKWKKEDIMKLLQEIGIEKIEALTVMPDSNNADLNRGFAFVELETNKDAQNAYKKLQKKDAFGKGRNIKVAWAEPLNDPDEEQMKKVKSVYAEGIPTSWNEEKVRECFKKFGEIERIVLACNIKSSKRKDFAFVNYKTREAALACIESFDKEELIDNGSQVNLKVSLAKPVQKGKQNKEGPKSSNKDAYKGKPKAVQGDSKASITSGKGLSVGAGYGGSSDLRSTNHELLHVLREQATWQRGQIGYARGSTTHNYPHGKEGKRPLSSLGDEAFYADSRGYPRARLDSFPPIGSSYGPMPSGTTGTLHPYYQRPGAHYGHADYPGTHQMRQGSTPHGSSHHFRY